MSNKSGGVPIVKQWGVNTNMNIQHGTYNKSENMSGCLISGTEYLGEISVSSTLANSPTDIGEVLFNLPMTPAMMPSTRIKQLMELFQVYAPKLLAVHFIPVVPATQNGSVVAGITFDPDYSMAEIPPGDQGLRVWMSMQGFEMVNVYQPFSVIWTPTVQDGYWSRLDDADSRLTIPGNLVVASASKYSPFDGIAVDLPLFNVMLSYEIEFERRGLQIPTPINTAGNAQFNAALFSDLFYQPFASFIGQEVCIESNTIPLLNYANPGYLLLCIVKGSTTIPGSYGWTNNGPGGPIGLMTFQSVGGTTLEMIAGTAFYLFWATEGVNRWWGLASSLTSALEKSSDVYWGAPGYIGTDTIDATFDFYPIPLS
jgi:hypothetical protein